MWCYLPWSWYLLHKHKLCFFKYKYSAPLPILQNTNYFKYKYSAPLPILRNTNYLFKCVLRLLVLLPLRSNKFLTAICWDFSSTSSLKMSNSSESGMYWELIQLFHKFEKMKWQLCILSLCNTIVLNTDVHIQYNRIRLASHSIQISCHHVARLICLMYIHVITPSSCL